MLRRSHKKSRAGCLECKRRHVKCDEQRPKCIICTLSERDCSYPSTPNPSAAKPPLPPPSVPASGYASAASNLPISVTQLTSANPTGDAPPVSRVPIPGLTSRDHEPQDARTPPSVNMAHMELLIRFNFAEHAPELNVELHEFSSQLLFKCALEAPYLMHQILAASARRLAALHPDRADYFLDQAMHLQTKAVSIYNETAAKEQIDQSNCSALLLFCSLLGRHLLADLLAKRDADFPAFLARYLEVLTISRGLMAMSVTAWDLLLESDIKHLVIWALDISQSTPQGNHCDELRHLVAESNDLDARSKDACLRAIAYLQVGFDGLLGADTRNQRYLMIFMWPASVPQEFTDLLSQRRPEAIAIMGYWALFLHYSRAVWHVADSGSHLLRNISQYLGQNWEPWLSWPLNMLAADPV